MQDHNTRSHQEAKWNRNGNRNATGYGRSEKAEEREKVIIARGHRRSKPPKEGALRDPAAAEATTRRSQLAVTRLGEIGGDAAVEIDRG
jgi:hypothetical protein